MYYALTRSSRQAPLHLVAGCSVRAVCGPKELRNELPVDAVGTNVPVLVAVRAPRAVHQHCVGAADCVGLGGSAGEQCGDSKQGEQLLHGVLPFSWEMLLQYLYNSAY